MRELLGGKGANLAEMTNIGLPVPQGFTVTTEACTQYYEGGRKINDEIKGQIMEYIGKMEEITGKKFGDKENPLLVSVRSGARASMPGMMDTILNLGLNEEVVNIIAAKSGNPRWAWDCYRRFIQMFSDVVMGVGKKYFERENDFGCCSGVFAVCQPGIRARHAIFLCGELSSSCAGCCGACFGNP
jgi:pyruvate,orthophosphate dikinase